MLDIVLGDGVAMPSYETDTWDGELESVVRRQCLHLHLVGKDFFLINLRGILRYIGKGNHIWSGFSIVNFADDQGNVSSRWKVEFAVVALECGALVWRIVLHVV